MTQQQPKKLLASIAIDLSPLRTSRDYRLLFIGQFVSAFGSSISFVVLPWQMYKITHSSLAVGMMGLVEFVPMFIAAFIGGTLADFIDRRRLIIGSEIGLAASCLVLVANALSPVPQAWILFLVAGVFSALNGIHRPALEALTPRLVEADQIPAIAALGSIRYNFNQIVGPAIAGVLAAELGAAAAFSIDAASFVCSVVTLLMIRSVPVPNESEQPGLSSVKEGLKYARDRQELLGTYLIDMNAMFFGMPMALFPAIADAYGGASVGLFYAMPAVGSLIVTVTSGWSARIRKHGLAITIAAAIWGLAIVGFGLSSNLWLALFFLALAGAADMVSALFRSTIWNQTIPDHLRGRMASIEMISYLTGPYLGNAEAGIVAGLVGLKASVVSGGILCVAGSGLLAMLLPRFINYDRDEGLARKAREEAERQGVSKD